MGRLCGLVDSGAGRVEVDRDGLHAFLANCYSWKKPNPFHPALFVDGGVGIAAEGEGMQFQTEDGSLVSAVDGHFAHYPHVLERFVDRGIDVRHCGPAEALLHYYVHEGLEGLKLLRGGYVFAIWHARERKLLLGRDPSGTKRICYSEVPGGLAFSSDLAALARLPMVDRAIGTDGLLQYFTFGYVCPPHTIYEGVRLLGPGEYLALESGRVKTDRFFSALPEKWKFHELNGTPEEEVVSKLDGLVVDATVCRVPEEETIAAYLSGGLDTGLLAAVLSRHTTKRVVAFTLGSNDPACDEVPEARKVVDELKIADHRCHYIQRDEFLDTLTRIPDLYGQPIADSSVIPNFVISKMVAEQFDRVIAGDGPDGLYGNWDLRPWFYYYRVMPRVLRTPFAGLVHWADRALGLGLSTPSRHISELLAQPDFAWVFHKKFKGAELARLVGRRVDADAFGVARFLDQRRDVPLYERLRIAFSTFFVVHGVLQKGCGVHNAVLLEQCCPFYDRELVDFVQLLPTRYKIRGVGYGKYLHKKLLYRYLPPEIWSRRKRGFMMNLNEFGIEPLQDLAQQYLTKERLSETGLFDADFALECVDQYFAGSARMGPLFYTFLVFEMWRERFGC